MLSSNILKSTVVICCLGIVIDSHAVNRCKTIRKIAVINDNNKPVQVDLTLPEYSEAQIRINNITPNQQVNSWDLLSKAIAKDSKEEIRKAIHAGADINYVKDSISPLRLALLLKKTVAFQFLLKCGAIPNKEMIEDAIKIRDIKAAYLLAMLSDNDINKFYSNSPCCEPNSSGAPLLTIACCCGDFETALLLVKIGAIPTRYALDIIAGNINNPIILAIIQTLINRGYDVNNFWALSCYSKEFLTLILQQYHANPNHIFTFSNNKKDKNTPLACAILQEKKEAVRILLEFGANINKVVNTYPLSKFKTPLALAIELGATEIIELLIEHGANLD
jgi:ankyrin repeat protein